MPRGVYVRTPEYRERVRQGVLKRTKDECKNGHSRTTNNTGIKRRLTGRQAGRIARYCLLCEREARRRYYRRDPAKSQASTRASMLRTKYGIDPQEYEVLFSQQGGCCALCGQPQAHRKLAVDHDHDTKQVRGLLCQSCNGFLGRFQDNPQALLGALRQYWKHEIGGEA